MSALLTCDEEEIDLLEAEQDADMGQEQEVVEINQMAEVSLNLVVGFASPKAMKL